MKGLLCMAAIPPHDRRRAREQIRQSVGPGHAGLPKSMKAIEHFPHVWPFGHEIMHAVPLSTGGGTRRWLQ